MASLAYPDFAQEALDTPILSEACQEIFGPAFAVDPVEPNVAPDLVRAWREMSACAHLRENR